MTNQTHGKKYRCKVYRNLEVRLPKNVAKRNGIAAGKHINVISEAGFIVMWVDPVDEGGFFRSVVYAIKKAGEKIRDFEDKYL